MKSKMQPLEKNTFWIEVKNKIFLVRNIHKKVISDFNSDNANVLEMAKFGANLVLDLKVDFPRNLESQSGVVRPLAVVQLLP